MRYFEIHDPYYAMLKATDQDEAINKYTEFVADDEEDTLKDEIREVSRDIALIMFSRGTGEGSELKSPAELLEEFNKEEADILLITSEFA